MHRDLTEVEEDKYCCYIQITSKIRYCIESLEDALSELRDIENYED